MREKIHPARSIFISSTTAILFVSFFKYPIPTCVPIIQQRPTLTSDKRDDPSFEFYRKKKTRSGKYARNFFQCITPFNVLSRRIIVALDKLETNMPSCYYRVSVVYYWTFLPFVFVVMKNAPVLRRATAVGKKLGKSSYTMSTE